eukprot:SAG22_NODE_705_length_7772_cov_45.048742_1_plen_283_part_10
MHLLLQPFYHKVLDGRPLVFLLSGANDNRTTDGIAQLQAATKAKLGVSCYLVYMGSAMQGADAVSQYMVAHNGAGGVPFSEGIAGPEKAVWQAAKANNKKLVPSITAGSDSRPRQEYPLPWGRRRMLAFEEDIDDDSHYNSDAASTSADGKSFCAVATQAKQPPYDMGVVKLSCNEASAKIMTIEFADFGTVAVSGGCGQFASGECSEAAFASGWAHHCVGQAACSLDPNLLQPPHHKDPCTGVPKTFAVEATCSGSAGGKATIIGPPPPPLHQESFVVDPSL